MCSHTLLGNITRHNLCQTTILNDHRDEQVSATVQCLTSQRSRWAVMDQDKSYYTQTRLTPYEKVCQSSATRKLLSTASQQCPSTTRILVTGFYPGRSHGLVTLSPECFSTFPHGTCLLSVLWKYLALGGVYLPLSAVCSNNATLRESQAKAHTHAARWALHPP